MATKMNKGFRIEKDIRAKLSQAASKVHPLSSLLTVSAALRVGDRDDLFIDVRELRRSIRFSDELQVVLMHRVSGSGCGWTLRVYTAASDRYADLVCYRGGVRHWKRLDAAVRFLQINCPRLKSLTIRFLG